MSAEEQMACDAALAASLQESTPEKASHGRGLKALPALNTPSPPPAVNRITEYEKGASTPPRKKEGPAFEVLKKIRSPNDKRSPIQDLPNEILTHSLAHLSPTDLTSVALVSKRFHDLVTGPHAWRSAFAHYFPGEASVSAELLDNEDDTGEFVRSDRRTFTRLTALASWRSEYVMRTRLLRSLARARPAQANGSPNAARSGQSHTVTPMIDYNSQLFTVVNHLHANFGNSPNKRPLRVVHGADDVGTATSSDPLVAKTESWGLTDPQMFLQFSERFPGDAQYGLGPGDVVGAPNVMDVSQPYGMIHGEGSPGGMVYYRSSDEMRGHFLQCSSGLSVPDMGVPRVASPEEAITSVWIAKSNAIPSLTGGLIGMLSGSSLGIVTAYALGSIAGANNREQRFARGEMTARWALSPGVPIIAIATDPEYSLKRQAQNRIWVVVLNALGEVFYLTKFPKRPSIDRASRSNDEALERSAWATGRGVYWSLVEPSRRTARPDPYANSSIDGSYSPRSSWNGMCLSGDQVQAETREIEEFTVKKPRDFRRMCEGWDMQRKLECDFAGDDGCNAGEHVIVFDCGLDENSLAVVRRYTRCRFKDCPGTDLTSTSPLTTANEAPANPPSLFGSTSPPILSNSPGFSFERLDESPTQDDLTGSITPRPMIEEWRTSTFSLDGLKHVQVLASAIDESVFATQTTSEDPLLGFSGRSTSSSPSVTPLSPSGSIDSSADMPGQRARLMAIGTKTGSILVWNVRAPTSKSAEVTTTIEPVRIIHTDSPQISCLAMSSLYLVHGGNDGLVQAWDPLGSSMQPIRTLHSRFSLRARRQLVQAQASAQGVGINMFAAGAICIDPDATVLRGVVSLGNRLRYWSFSSSAADEYKSRKRRFRRSERGSNNNGEKFSGATRTNLKTHIDNERLELEREQEHRKKEAQRLAGRFGTQFLDGNEEEMMAYAAILSQESLEMERLRRASDTSATTSTTAVSTDHSNLATGNATPGIPSPRMSTPKTDDELDADIAEAIRQSLAPSPSTAAFDIPIRHAKPKGRKSSSARPSPRVSPLLIGSSKAHEMSDLDFALQLSLAEEQSKQQQQQREEGDFPTLSSRGGHGKGKSRTG
ncbi:f-box/wd-repeat protein pof10 [Teratosphaeria destructans]|uniref:F-box/wd-repeat protein pof10 n=1 Tax=Teratosphaeria destructans TaxID=418781 RepID=A0A9W7SST8_9PEZI|nr:f-box/wd-repeat protein pof10 [Teratosphaeria destructans]